jgi:tetratricopeptide (TPR) repeat protein
VELETAVRQDPKYALAWSGLADTYVLLGPSSPGSFPKAKAAAERALGLDPDLAEAHASLGFTRFFSDWDFAGGERELRRAIELDPGYATAHQWYAFWLVAASRFDAAVAEIQRARDIDPLSIVLREDVGHILTYARRYPEAIVELRRVLSLDPSFSKVRVYLVSALIQAGRYDEAREEIRRLNGWPDKVEVRAWDARLSAVSGRVEEARAFAPKVLEAGAAGVLPPDGVALLCGVLGDKDLAFQWLERAFRERRFYLVFLNADPAFDPLRLDARFADLVRRVGIPS